MGEAERLVIMERHQDVGVVGGQLQLGQPGQAVPVGRADHQRAVRVGGAHHGNQPREQGIPAIGVELAMRLVEQLERYRCGRGSVALADLSPERLEPGFAGVGIVGAFVEVVLVDDDRQPGIARLSDHPVERRQPARVEPVLRVHMVERLKDQADEVEAPLADGREMARLKSGMRRVRPQRVVPQHVDAAVKARAGRRCGMGRCGHDGGEQRRQRDPRAWGHRRFPPHARRRCRMAGATLANGLAPPSPEQRPGRRDLPPGTIRSGNGPARRPLPPAR